MNPAEGRGRLCVKNREDHICIVMSFTSSKVYKKIEENRSVVALLKTVFLHSGLSCVYL